VYTTGLQADMRTIDRAYYSSLGDASGLAVDNQAQLDVETGAISQRLMGGLDFQRITAASVQAFAGAPSLDIFDPQYGQPIADVAPFIDNVTRQQQLGLYLQDRVEIGPRWVLSLAGRHDWARTEVRDHLTGARTSQDDAAFTFRGGLLFNSAVGLAPYYSYSESFLPTAGTDAEGSAFEPERGRQYEVGLKYGPSSWNGFVTVSLFDLTRRNYLQYDPETFVPIQGGEARSRGLEAEAVAGLLTGLNLRGALTVMDVEVMKSSDPTALGRRPAQTPDRLASLWADYTVMSGKLSGLGAGMGVRYIGAAFGDAQNTIDIPSVTLADAEAFYDWRDFRLSVNVQNLFDERYVASAFARSSLLATFGPARSITASLRYRW
jgi:iron complex outermembrane receptor protein